MITVWVQDLKIVALYILSSLIFAYDWEVSLISAAAE